MRARSRRRVVAALVVALACAGCRAERKEEAAKAPEPVPVTSPPAASSGYEAIEVTGGGSVSGQVVFRGSKPKLEPRPVTKDNATCGHQPKPSEAVQLGSGGALANTVVALEGIRRGKRPDPATLVLDQRRCDYIPHVQSATAGATIDILNSDNILHNIHGYLNGRETIFNLAMPLEGQKIIKTLTRPGVISLRCDAGHTWMDAYIVVADSPYHATTRADGKFTIGEVPAGSYKLKAWHERLGSVEQDVTVASGADTSIEIAFR